MVCPMPYGDHKYVRIYNTQGGHKRSVVLCFSVYEPHGGTLISSSYIRPV